MSPDAQCCTTNLRSSIGRIGVGALDLRSNISPLVRIQFSRRRRANAHPWAEFGAVHTEVELWTCCDLVTVIVNYRPHEVAPVDSDVAFRHNLQ